MAENIDKSGFFQNLLVALGFISFGIAAFINPIDKFNPFNLGFGIIVGLFFGWLFKKFLRVFVSLFNPSVKKDFGKKVIHNVVDNAMAFMIPFAVMILLSVFYLGWTLTNAFISAGVMAVGTAASIEIGKLKGKQEIKNTIISSGVAFLFSFVWTISSQFLGKAPGMIEALVGLVISVLKQGGGIA